MNGYYFDGHVNPKIANALIDRGYTVMTAVDADLQGKDDDTEHLPFAIAHQLVLVTLDRGFAGRTSLRTDHPGFICLTDDLHKDIGRAIEELALFAELYDPGRDAGNVYWYP